MYSFGLVTILCKIDILRIVLVHALCLSIDFSQRSALPKISVADSQKFASWKLSKIVNKLTVNIFVYIVVDAEQWFRIQKCWCRPNFIKIKDAQRKIKHLAWTRCWLSWSMSLREFKTFMNLGGPAGSLGSRKAATAFGCDCIWFVELSKLKGWYTTTWKTRFWNWKNICGLKIGKIENAEQRCIRLGWLQYYPN